MLELYGSPSCPYTAQLREDLEWRKVAFVEHDVEGDANAFARLLRLTDGASIVPVLVEDGNVLQIGYEGRGCYASGA